MSDFKVLVADAIDLGGVELLKQSVAVDFRPDITPEQVLAEIGNYDGLVVRSRTKVREGVLRAGAAGNLKVVGRAGVGVDNIDLTVAKEVGVTVVNSPLPAATAVAELTFGLMFALARKITFADNLMKQGEWPKKQSKGNQIQGKTLGIVAMGRIGAAVATRATAFGLNVIGYDPFMSADAIEGRGAKAVDLDTLLAESDYISMHMPLTPDTKHFINADTIAKMKDGVRILCPARGGVIDEAALLAAIESGKVAGAGLDVFETEPPGATDLVKHEKVVATPHIGAQTAEAQAQAGVDIAAEVLKVLNGEELSFRVV